MANILIVEDETIIALDIKNTVRKLGHKVVAMATTGEDAIKKVHEHNNIDIVFMDINLGKGKNGIETASDILKLKDVSIIYLTAHIEDDIMKAAIKTEPIGYLKKPFKRKHINDIINIALQKTK